MDFRTRPHRRGVLRAAHDGHLCPWTFQRRARLAQLRSGKPGRFFSRSHNRRAQDLDLLGEVDYRVTGQLTIRGVTKPVTLDVHYLGQWQTPWWEDGVDKGPKARAGFVAKTSINRQDFGVSWNDTMDKGGIVVSNTVDITIDAEAILEDE